MGENEPQATSNRGVFDESCITLLSRRSGNEYSLMLSIAEGAGRPLVWDSGTGSGGLFSGAKDSGDCMLIV